MNTRLHPQAPGQRPSLRARAWLCAIVSVLAWSCGGKTDQRIGRVLPTPGGLEPPPLTGVDAAAPSGDAAAGCTPQPLTGPIEEPQLALYLLVDRSQYMRSQELRNDKWNAVIDYALSSFVTSSEANPLHLGLGYYPLPNRSFDNQCICTLMPRCGNCRDPQVTCNLGAYGPDVEIMPPGQHAALATSIDMHGPNGAAPLAPAWLASEDYLQTWQLDNRKKKVVRVLIAGGAPWTDGCGGDRLTDVVASAASSRFRTYVISLDPGANVLDTIAASGGTGKAIPVDSRGDVRTDLFDAMQQIVSAEKGCDLLIPDSLFAAHQHLDVITSLAPLGNVGFTEVENRQACSKDQELAVYTDARLPRVSLCDTTCVQVHALSLETHFKSDCDKSPIPQ